LIISRHINTYYRNLLGIKDTRLVSLSHDFWANVDKLTNTQAQQFVVSFFLDEVKKIVFLCNPSKVPGLDGFFFSIINHVGILSPLIL
jgi:hypothetical protein